MCTALPDWTTLTPSQGGGVFCCDGYYGGVHTVTISGADIYNNTAVETAEIADTGMEGEFRVRRASIADAPQSC